MYTFNNADGSVVVKQTFEEAKAYVKDDIMGEGYDEECYDELEGCKDDEDLIIYIDGFHLEETHLVITH